MMRKILRSFGPLIGLIAVFFLFVALGPPSFGSWRNIETILRQTAIVGTAALGMTVVIISGGIDLSVGSLVALSTVVLALLVQQGFESGTSVLITIFLAACLGYFNGMLVTRLKVGAFIVTLGSLLIFRGVAKGLAGEQKIDAPMTKINDLLATLEPGSVMLVPSGVWITLILSVAVWIFLTRMRLGRHIVAVGSNERTAYLCGIEVTFIRRLSYLLGGLFGGIAGVFQFSRLSVGDPTVAVGLELEVIAAVVIGGASLSGGTGSVSGSLIGALIMSVIRSGCSQMGLPNWVQEIFTGILILVAVSLDRIRASLKEKSKSND